MAKTIKTAVKKTARKVADKLKIAAAPPTPCEQVGKLNCPTAYGFANDIRPMFTDTDVSCMQGQGLDLSDYSQVSGSASLICKYVASGRMPKPDSGEKPWTPDMVMKFACWIQQGCNP